MSYRILLVDDDAGVLQVHALMLETAQHDWDIRTAVSGREALDLLDAERFDVVISDLRMPEMDGTELLGEVAQRFPGIARMVLSAYADQQMVSRALGVTHQCLAKPVNPTVFRDTLARVIGLRSTLYNERVRALVGSLKTVPSVPSLYFKLVHLLESPNCGTDQIAEVLAADPGMTVKLLQLVNSAFFGISQRANTAQDAVQILGLNTVRSLTLSMHVFSCYESSSTQALSVEGLWSHSLRTGFGAQAIMRAERARGDALDEAFVSGMLHDAGKMLLAANMPTEYAEIAAKVQEGEEPSAAERSVVGVSHAELAAYLLGLWGLPLTLVEAVALHHEPLRSGDKSLAPLTAVHVANQLAHEIEGDPAAIQRVNIPYLQALGLEHRLPEWQEIVEERLREEEDLN